MLASDIKDILGPSASASTDPAAEFEVRGKEKTAATKNKSKTQKKKKRSAVDALRIDAVPVDTEDVVAEVVETPYQQSRRLFGKRYTRRWKKGKYFAKPTKDERAKRLLKRMQQRFPDDKLTLERSMDRVNLSHWVPAGHPIEGQWAKPSTTQENWPPYSDEEYNKLLVDEDWSREETDYLMRQARRFHFSFLVVQDRYDFQGESRSLEQIKKRFYEVDSILKRAKNPTDNTGDYDIQKELTYRDQVKNLTDTTSRDEVKESYMLHLVMDAMQRAKNEPPPRIQKRCVPLVAVPAEIPSFDDVEWTVPKRMQEPRASHSDFILTRDTLQIPFKDENVVKQTQNFLKTMFEGAEVNNTVGMRLPCHLSPSAQHFAEFRDNIPRYLDLLQAYHVALDQAQNLRANAAVLGLPVDNLPVDAAPHKLSLPVRTSSGESVPSFFSRSEDHVYRLVSRKPITVTSVTEPSCSTACEDTDTDGDVHNE